MNRTVLVIEDSPKIRREIVETLSGASLFDTCLEASDGMEGLRIALSTPVDLILCDLVMPRMDGFRFLQLFRARPDLHNVPLIMLTGRGDPASKVRGLEEGASDYVTKPFDRAELLARVKVHLKIKELQDELREANLRLTELSNTDALTSLYNRRFLFESLGKELQRVKRKGTMALLIMDLDHFKQVNDRFGHQQGDVVLAGVAGAILREVRTYDIAARYGGEEFVMILPDVTLEEGGVVAERLRMAVRQMAFPPPLGNLRVTVSIGVTASRRGETEVEELFRRGDAALYRAKGNGRDRVELEIP